MSPKILHSSKNISVNIPTISDTLETRTNMRNREKADLEIQKPQKQVFQVSKNTFCTSELISIPSEPCSCQRSHVPGVLYLLSKLSLIQSSNSWPLLHEHTANSCLPCCPLGFPGPFPAKLLPMLNRKFPSKEVVRESLLLEKGCSVTHLQPDHQNECLQAAPRHVQEGFPPLCLAHPIPRKVIQVTLSQMFMGRC